MCCVERLLYIFFPFRFKSCPLCALFCAVAHRRFVLWNATHNDGSYMPFFFYLLRIHADLSFRIVSCHPQATLSSFMCVLTCVFMAIGKTKRIAKYHILPVLCCVPGSAKCCCYKKFLLDSSSKYTFLFSIHSLYTLFFFFFVQQNLKLQYTLLSYTTATSHMQFPSVDYNTLHPHWPWVPSPYGRLQTAHKSANVSACAWHGTKHEVESTNRKSDDRQRGKMQCQNSHQ